MDRVSKHYRKRKTLRMAENKVKQRIKSCCTGVVGLARSTDRVESAISHQSRPAECNGGRFMGIAITIHGLNVDR